MSDGWSRRSVLKSSLGLSLAGVSLSGTTGTVTGASEYETLRQRWAQLLTGGDFDETQSEYQDPLAELDQTAQDHWETMDTSADRDRLWSDLPIPASSSASAGESNITDSYGRLQEMAMAYVTNGSSLENDSALVADVVDGLDFLYDRVYNEDQSQFGNWWHWEIGSPMRLVSVCALVGDELSSTQETNYTNAVGAHTGTPYEYTEYDVTSGGANRVDMCIITALRGAISGTDSTIALARDCIEESDIFQYNTSGGGNGLYRDGSYVYHEEIPYIGSYGAILLEGLGELFTVLDGTTWEITAVDHDVIYDTVGDAVAPFMYRGLMMDAVSGRSISRADQTDHVRGHGITATVLRLANTAPEPYASEFRSLAKGWIENDTWDSFLSGADVPDIANATAVLDDSTISAADEPVRHDVFHNMDRVVHNRSEWAYTISMCSERIARYEAINEENLRGWYTGAGMTQLYNDDLGHYTDGYWPTVDPYRLPGTTVDTRDRSALDGTHHPRPSTQWVGGASVDEFGIAGMEFDAEGASLTGKKSWLLLDDTVVALGADITSSDGRPIETTVENRNLHTDGSETLTVDDTEKSTTPDWSETLTDVSWAHLDGVGGYLFPNQPTLEAKREERTGSWQEINAGGPSESLTREYQTLWLDHGVDPSAETYAYALLPGHTASETRQRNQEPGFEIVANDATVQAVTVPRLGLTAANFWSSGSITVPGSERTLSVSGPAAVVVRHRNDELVVGVADPSRTQETVTVEYDHYTDGIVSTDSAVGVTQFQPRVTMAVAVGGTRGVTHSATFDAPVTELSPRADTFVRDGSYAGDNYGSWSSLVVKGGPTGYSRESYLAFDLASVAGEVQEAVLDVYGAVTDDNGGASVDCTVAAVDDDSWTEGGLTWDTKPDLGSSLGSLTVTRERRWWREDVTEFVQTAAIGDGPASVALRQPNDERYASFDSREADENPPSLRVTTSRPDTTALTPTADTFVRNGSYSSDNYGSWSSLVVKNASTGYSRQGYLTFDLSALSGSVDEAVLYLYGAVTDDSGGDAVDCAINAVDDDSWTEDGLTWDTKPEVGSALGSVTVTRTPQWWTVDVTKFVRSEAGGDGVVSLAVQQPQSGLYTDFNSRDADEKVPTLRVQTS